MIINIDDNNDYIDIFDFKVLPLVKKLAKEVFRYHRYLYDFSFDLSIVSARKIKFINKVERNIDKPTDVLSFPNVCFKKPGNFNKYVKKNVIDASIFDLDTKTIFLGSIVICYDKVLSQAKKYGHSIKREFSFLVVHSILHLLGYDHMNKNDEEKMFGIQNVILDNLKIKR